MFFSLNRSEFRQKMIGAVISTLMAAVFVNFYVSTDMIAWWVSVHWSATTRSTKAREEEEQDRQGKHEMIEELQDHEEQWARSKTIKRSGAARSRESRVGSSKKVNESIKGRDRPSKRMKLICPSHGNQIQP